MYQDAFAYLTIKIKIYISYIWLWKFAHPASAHLSKIEEGGKRPEKGIPKLYLFLYVYFQGLY